METKTPDNYMYLIIKTSARGACEILFAHDNEERAEDALIIALKSYAEDIKSGACRIDMYKYY